MTWALVTGGTSGLGAAFARRLAEEGSDIVLVARDEERLQTTADALRERFGVETETISADLATPAGVAAVASRLQGDERPVQMFVNNAGFGLQGGFLDVDVEGHRRMMQVNAVAVLELTHAASTSMARRGGGDIVNVSSVAGFTPTVRPSSTYAATKAFVTALSEGLAPSLEKDGVRLSAVCPGWVRTEFHQRAGHNMSNLPAFLWLDADEVAEAALADHRAGKPLSIPGLRYKLIVGVVRLLPLSVARRLSHLVGRRAR